MPLLFLAVSAVLNIALDFMVCSGIKTRSGRSGGSHCDLSICFRHWNCLYTRIKYPELLRRDKKVRFRLSRVKEITGFSALTCLQQSIMNLGILMVQGLVNSFGTTIMAAFAAAVKIDAFAYLPVQDFGNAFFYFYCAELWRKTN
mgnify:CR=1 FL=1